MTAARRERKSHGIASIRLAILGAIVALAGATLVAARVGAATTESVVANLYTGLAIDGFDPVAYFVNAEPSVGRADLEFRLAGATWRFRNEGNRAAFIANPDVYMPRFGGHDPIAIARGAPTPGHPRVWLVVESGLYLFYSVEARAAFAQMPERAAEAAEQRWPDVLRTLAR
jgi:hypothetical protein